MITFVFSNVIKGQDLVDYSNLHKLNENLKSTKLTDIEKIEQKPSELLKLNNNQVVSKEDQPDIMLIFFQMMLAYQAKCKLKLCDSLPVLVHPAPKIIVYSIENKTPYRLAFTDRFLDSFQYILPGKSRVKVKYEVNNYRSMTGFDVKGEAQFTVEVLDSDFEWIIKKSYYNMAIASCKGSEQKHTEGADNLLELRYSTDDGGVVKNNCSKRLKDPESKNVYVSIILDLNDRSQIRSLYSHQDVNMNMVRDACSDTIKSLFLTTEK